MCGIAGIYRFRESDVPVGTLIDKLLTEIEHRGRDATGVAITGFDKSVLVDKAPVRASVYVQKRPTINDRKTRIVMGHTRATTKGAASNPANNHPVVHGPIVVSHNGSIYNDDELFGNAELGLVRCAEVDTEAIAAVLAKDGMDHATTALERLEGWFAIAAQDMTNPDELILAKGHSSPLHYHITGKMLVWASEKSALRNAWASAIGTPPAWDNISTLETGEMLIVTPDGIEKHTFKAKEGTVSRSYYSGHTAWWDSDEYDDYVVPRRGWRNRSPLTTMPTPEQVRIAKTYTDWALYEQEISDMAVELVASATKFEIEFVRWLLFTADSKIVNGKDMREFYRWLDKKYTETFDRLMESDLVEIEAEEAKEEVKEADPETRLGEKLAEALEERARRDREESLSSADEPFPCINCQLHTDAYPCYFCDYFPGEYDTHVEPVALLEAGEVVDAE